MSESGGEESSQPGKRKVKADDIGEEELQLAAEDPLLVFGSEIMTIILAKLDLRSVVEARLVSRGWQAVASADRIWGPKVIFVLPFSPFLTVLFSAWSVGFALCVD
ncbi:hypothetical protein AAHA92_22043 [Salvia divinorum]|uniref:F-box domain-containing protein n=1 Tax=Salvia divinorum TaxID=28513 RepID=A0ABD1GNL1_SALDI